MKNILKLLSINNYNNNFNINKCIHKKHTSLKNSRILPEPYYVNYVNNIKI